MFIFSKTFNGFYIFKDFKDPWGPCSDKLTDSLSHIPPNHRNAQQDIPSITQNKY